MFGAMMFSHSMLAGLGAVVATEGEGESLMPVVTMLDARIECRMGQCVNISFTSSHCEGLQNMENNLAF